MHGFAAIALAMPSAATAEPGMNLSWGDCYGDRPSSNRSFACNTNVGAQQVVVSFVAPAGVTEMSGMEIRLDLFTADVVPDWWRLFTSGSCRQRAMTMNFFPSNLESNCRDLWEGQGSGGIGAYTVGYLGNPSRARIVAAAARAYVGPLDANVEYFAFNLMISNMRTIGADSCAGCSRGARLVLNSIKLTQPIGVGDFSLSSSVLPFSNRLDWQGGVCIPDPIRNTTWGGVKALYH